MAKSHDRLLIDIRKGRSKEEWKKEKEINEGLRKSGYYYSVADPCRLEEVEDLFDIGDGGDDNGREI